MQTPELPAAAAVTLDGRTTALLVLDITDQSTKNVPACRESVPAVKRLIDHARAAGAKGGFALGRAAGPKIAQELEPRPEDPVVRARAEQVFTTDLDTHLAGKAAGVIVGTPANRPG